MTVTQDTLAERLRRRVRQYDYITGTYGCEHFANPDGPEAAARIEQLEATLARQAEALEPFASVAEWDIGEEEDDDDLFRVMMGGHNYAPLLRVGDLRRALQAWETRHDL